METLYCAPEEFDRERFERGIRLLAKALLIMIEKRRRETEVAAYENITKAPREGV